MNKQRHHWLFSLLILGHFTTASAGFWIEPGDMQLRSDLLLLNDTGLINIPITTWPLAWDDVDRAVAKANVGTDELSANISSVLSRVTARRDAALRDAALHGDFRVSYFNEPQLIRTFEDVPRRSGEASASAEWMVGRIAARLEATVSSDLEGDTDTWLDGSYVGGQFGNWMVSAGAQERWWGPGWDGSLILGTNARPVPAVSLRRVVSTPPDISWLRWVGPWQFETFLGQMEEDRHISNAKLWAARFTFKPFPRLEIGLSRAAQWGGDGRPEDLDAIWNMLIGHDNGPSDGHTADEPGNQLGGYDLRWNIPSLAFPLAFYHQQIGEDESEGLPTAKMWLFGLENWGALNGRPYRLYLEYADTATHRTTVGYNTAYNHHLYLSGYRYYERSLGHSMDNDGEMWSLGGIYAVSPVSSWNLRLTKADLNRDGTGSANTVSPGLAQTLYQVSLSNRYRRGSHQFYWGVGWQNLEAMESGTSETERSLFLQWQYLTGRDGR